MKETRFYAVRNDFATDILKSLGIDPKRVTRLKFEFKAEDDRMPLVIELDYMPEYTGLVKPYEAQLFRTETSKEDALEAAYRANET